MGQNPSSLNRERVVVAARPVQRRVEYHHPDQPPEDDRTIRDLEHDIARTRSDMSLTIDALQDRLRPERIKQEVKGKAREMVTNNRYPGGGLVERIRQNPIPAALVAVGVGWLFAGGRRDDSYEVEDYRRYGYRYYDSGTAREERTGIGAGRVQDVRDQVANRAGDLKDQVAGRAGDLGGQAQYQAQRARGGFEQLIEDNPLAVGAVALALGAAIGLSAPLSDRENQLMGDARDNLMDKAQAAAEDAGAKAKRVIEKTAAAARENVQSEM